MFQCWQSITWFISEIAPIDFHHDMPIDGIMSSAAVGSMPSNRALTTHLLIRSRVGWGGGRWHGQLWGGHLPEQEQYWCNIDIRVLAWDLGFDRVRNGNFQNVLERFRHEDTGGLVAGDWSKQALLIGQFVQS